MLFAAEGGRIWAEIGALRPKIPKRKIMKRKIPKRKIMKRKMYIFQRKLKRGGKNLWDPTDYLFVPVHPLLKALLQNGENVFSVCSIL